MHDFFKWLFGEQGQIVIAGALGGVVRWLTLREKWTEGFISVAVGAICAVYLGPLVKPAVTPVLGGLLETELSRSSFAGFMLGLGGITISGFVIDIWRARQASVKAETKKGDEE